MAYRAKLSRGKLLSFLASEPNCTVAMEACGSAHYWGREIMKLGYEVRVVPPVYVKPFVKRHKNDAADAEAISEAGQRPTMHFVAVKTEARQALALLFRTRDLLVRQPTQTINALRGHLAEFGIVAPQGTAQVRRLARALEDPDSGRPEAVVELGSLLLAQIDELDKKIDGLDKKLRASAREDEDAARMMTIPGIGPVTARTNRYDAKSGAIAGPAFLREGAAHWPGNKSEKLGGRLRVRRSRPPPHSHGSSGLPATPIVLNSHTSPGWGQRHSLERSGIRCKMTTSSSTTKYRGHAHVAAEPRPPHRGPPS